ncbi:transmembrane protein 186 [Uranotaenia lowii]|uniref:transmembrane protein 186 n=1 Tax=Uranotaenia lowii TaxID=190385 RepID=UPI00247A2BF5|nr:transmembrane protein 186 [Uranotaenia lowii]
MFKVLRLCSASNVVNIAQLPASRIPLAGNQIWSVHRFFSKPSTLEQNIGSDSDKSTAWNTIYHFPGIMLTASIKRLQTYPMIMTAVSVPISMGLAYADLVSMTTAQVCGSIGFTTTATLLLFSYLTNNLIGYVYTDDACNKVKIAYVDKSGKRQNRIYTIDDIVPRTEMSRSLFSFYFPVKNHDNRDQYKLIHRYGQIYDYQAFARVFGRDV